MSSDESLELEGPQESRSIPVHAEEWGREFVKRLEMAYADTAGDLPADAASPELRRAMVDAIAEVLIDSGADHDEIIRVMEASLISRLPGASETEWTDEMNARRLVLIDKKIQRAITSQEAIELARLTAQMRFICDREEMLPLEGVRRLHRRLLGIDNAGSAPG